MDQNEAFLVEVSQGESLLIIDCLFGGNGGVLIGDLDLVELDIKSDFSDGVYS